MFNYDNTFITKRGFNLLTITMTFITNSPRQTWSRIIVGTLLGLMGVWLATATVHASTPVVEEPTVDVSVTRNENFLIATAFSNSDDQIDDNSWRWIRNTDCDMSFFTNDAPVTEQMRWLKGTGWTVPLTADDVGQHYCFYVETVAGTAGFGKFRISWPMIQIEPVTTSKGLALQATVVNAERDSFTVDESSWQWYRFERITDSRFGCSSRHVGLDDDGLRAAAQRAQEIQQADGVASSDVYAAQKDVYKTGDGTIAYINMNDVGLTYCFRAVDTTGIQNVRSVVVTEDMFAVAEDVDEIIEDVDVIYEDATAVPTDEADATATDDEATSTTDDAESTTNARSNSLIRNIGLGVLGLALILGVFLIIKRSQSDDDDDDES